MRGSPIELGLDESVLDDLRTIGTVCAWTALGLGALALLGWYLGWEPLKTTLPGHMAVTANTTLGIVLAATALLLAGGGSRWRLRAATLLGCAVGLLGGLTALEWISGWDLGIDRWLFVPAGAVETTHPGRMASVTTLEFMLLAGCMLLPAQQRVWAQRLATVGVSISGIALLGYTFGAESLYGFGFVTHMALSVALSFTLLFMTILMRTADRGWVARMAGRYAGGAMLRRVIPFAILAPWIMCWITVGGSRAGFYSYRTDQVLTAGPLIVLSIIFLLRCASALDRLDRKEQERRREIEALNRELETRVLRRTEELSSANERNRLGELRYRSLVEATAQIVWTTDPQGEVCTDMPMWRDFTGQTEAQIQGWGWIESLHPEDRARAAEAWAAAVQCRSLYEIGYRLRRHDGAYRDMAVRGVPVLEPGGGIREWVGTCTDITDRKRAEHSAETERRRFLDVLDGLPAYVVLLTQDYQVAFSNRVFRERFGESQGRRCYEFLFQRQTPCEVCETFKVLSAGAPLKWKWTGPDGRHYDVSDFPFTDVDGSRLILEMGIDVTEQMRLEQEVSMASRYARSLIEASLDPLVTISKAGKIMDVNQATEAVTGVSRAELIASDFSDYFTDPAEARSGYEQAFELGLVRDYPLAIRHRDGRLTDVLYNATVYRNQAGEVEGVFAAARDITKRKQAEAELRRLNRSLRAMSRCTEAVARAGEEQALLRSVCEIVAQDGGYPLVWVGYAEHDKEKTVRPVAIAGRGADYVRAARITWADTERGRGPTGIALRSGTPCYVPEITLDPRFMPWREAALRCGYASAIAVPLLEGEHSFGALNIYAPEPHAFESEEYVLMLELAATLAHGILALRAHRERDRAAAELRDLNETLERRVAQRTAELAASTEEMEAFTYSVSHDLRAPLRHIDGFSKVLLEECSGGLDELGRHYLARVRDGTQRMGQLVDDLLNLSRLGRCALDLRPTALGTIVQELVEEFQPEAAGRPVEWRIGGLPRAVCDRGLMRQVFINLLANALKFSRGRDPAIIEVGMAGRELFVRDNGVGFDPQYAPKLFGVFQRLHRSEDFPGSGVGLATVRRILRKHGGDIRAEASLDAGATFYFTLGEAALPSGGPAVEESHAA